MNTNADNPHFMSLVFQYQATGFTALGKTPNPMTGKLDRNLELARYCIDTLAMLEEKTRGNLSATESRELMSALTNLRLNFVQEMKAEQSAPASAATPSPELDYDDDDEDDSDDDSDEDDE